MAKKLENFRNLNQSNKQSSTKKVGEVARKRIKKEKQKEKSVFSKVVIFFLILVFMGVAIGILFSPAFNLSKVIIAEGENVSKAEISNLIDVTYGENILKQNYKSIKENILTLPYIKDVKIKLNLPDKIKIDYIERKPYMLLKYLESFFVVDQYGYLLEIKKENNLPNYPIIYGIEIDSYELGKPLSDTSGIKYRNVVTLIETAKQREFPYSIYEVNYESIAGVKLWLEGFDVDVIYGEIDKDTVTDKLNFLAGVLKSESIRGKSGELDISSENYLEKTIFTERY